MITNSNNILSENGIESALKTEYIGRDLHFFERVTSTFDASKECEPHHGSVICAREQTDGRGRLGRSWQSRSGGIYVSLMLDPAKTKQSLQLMTLVCALGIQRALSRYLPCFIKWPNDIVSKDGKKLCGILTKIDFIDGKSGYINVGIGINANTEGFSQELKYAASVKQLIGEEVDENEVLCTVFLEIERCLKYDDSKILDEFSAACLTLGAHVKAIYTDGKTFEGICRTIGSDGSLVIEKDDGTTVRVCSGEVSVRGIYDGYV
ncbi:MAG: biotin--[Clostridia bacterium]|nr:biotin--[acetyl-CoA-carboxylase] ligase [Clostridia bacterium]